MDRYQRSYNASALVALAVLISISCVFYWSHAYVPVITKVQTAQVGGSSVSATYYVSPSGDDANPGTIDKPWKTFGRAFDTTQSAYLHGGDTLYLRGGIYRFDEAALTSGGNSLATDQISGTPGQPTRISGYPGEQAYLYMSARMDSGWQKYTGRSDGNIWYTDWQKFVQNNYPYQYAYDNWQSGNQLLKFTPQVVAIDYGQPVLLQEVNSEKNGYHLQDAQCGGPCMVSVRTSENDMIAGDFYYESDPSNSQYGRLFVWLPDSSDPNGKPIEVGINRWIMLGSQHDVDISDISVRYSNYDGLVIGGSNNVVDTLDSEYNGFAGLGGMCDNCTVKNSILSNNGNEGSGLEGNGTIYDNNTINANNYRLFSAKWACGGIKLIPGLENMVIKKNTVENNKLCPGIWFDSMGGGHTIERNTFSGNGTGGAPINLMIEISAGTANQPIVVRNNIFENGNLYISASHYVDVYNNVFYNSAGTAHGLDAGAIRQSIDNISFLNNIFYQTDHSHVPLFIVQDVSAPYSSTNNTSDYNIFYSPTGPLTFGGTMDWSSNWSFSDWQKRGFDAHSIVADPQFANANAGQFSVPASSPAIDNGTPLSLVPDDFIGNKRPDAGGAPGFDIGAYELAVPSVNTPQDLPLPPVLTVQNSPPPYPSSSPSPTASPSPSPSPSNSPAATVSTPSINNGSISPPTSSYAQKMITISNIQISVGPYSATISWNTDAPVSGRIDYGLTNVYGNTYWSGSAFAASHQILLSGLNSNTTYHFKIISADASGNIAASGDSIFTTAAVSAPAIIDQNPPVLQTVPQNPTTNLVPNITKTNNPYYDVPPPINNQNNIKFILTPINRNLKFGDTGNDVRILQTVLDKLGYTIAETGAGTLGNETGLFDENTLKALKAFQKNNAATGITSSGTLDNATLALVNAEIGRLNSNILIPTKAPSVTTTGQSILDFINTAVNATMSVFTQLIRFIANFL
ncbi:peptidoglycan-binding protein [Patescibacteria group bacterium]|nr:peptidoglycan-binding protein [Patescibacteria group bacterium]MDE1946841.1 peptidoglycan-binding protein [Patescibacteria group bacterium]MDE2010661.1 peptidoglycan-binding protein [Patescibacteria group bacterium]